jgi:hypothetical protein
MMEKTHLKAAQLGRTGKGTQGYADRRIAVVQQKSSPRWSGR